MRLLFFCGDRQWSARARIFVAAAHGLARRGHEVSLACPPGPIIDRLDPRAVNVVRIDPLANAAVGTFDFRRVAQERSIEVAFVHTAREQLIVGSGMRFAGGGRVVRRIPIFCDAGQDHGAISSRVAPTSLVVALDDQLEGLPDVRWATPPAVVPIGVDPAFHDALPRPDRRAFGLRTDSTVIGCPYSPEGRIRLLNVFRTIALLAPRHQRLRAIVFGQGATDDDLRMHAAALGVAPFVQFIDTGAADERILTSACDLVWITADHDAAAIGCLDAMALRLPLVAERSRTAEYFIADGINGALLPEGEPSVVASAVATVISRSDARVAYGNAGRARLARDFTEPAMIEGFERAAMGATAAVAT